MKKVLYIMRIISIVIIMFLAALVFIPSVLGITPTIDLLGTMKPKISKGAISYINERYKYNNVKKNDIIEIKKYNQKILVRVQEKNEKNNTLTVKGDAESKQEMIIISKKEYIGKYLFSIPKAGLIVLFLQRNFFLTIILIIIIVISLITDYLDYKNIDITQGIKLSKTTIKEETKKEEKQKETKIEEKTLEILEIYNDDKEKDDKDDNNKSKKEIEILKTNIKEKDKIKEESSNNEEQISEKKSPKKIKKQQNIEILDDDEIKEINKILDEKQVKSVKKKKQEPEILYSKEEKDNDEEIL